MSAVELVFCFLLCCLAIALALSVSISANERRLAHAEALRRLRKLIGQEGPQ